MPEHGLLREAALFLLDLQKFCAVAKPALFDVAELVLFVAGLVWLLGPGASRLRKNSTFDAESG